ncbi:hypothetical protein CMK14_02135 [Candidatus Poribacteria bacterium]|nr:hypothetical protein [Candidatus Poribacteria bacterium]
MPEPVEWDTPGALEAKKCPEPSSFRRGAARDQYRDAGMHGPRQYEISWRLVYDESVRYLSKAEVWFLLQVARRLGANLLMKSAPVATAPSIPTTTGLCVKSVGASERPVSLANGHPTKSLRAA